MTTLATLASALLLPTLAITLGYLGSCVIWPFRTCRHCQGYGQRRGWLGGIRFCPTCDGTGLRLRFGRRLINNIRRLYRETNAHRDR